MKNDRLSATGISFEKNEQGEKKPFLFCRRGNGGIRCLLATRESNSQETRLCMGRKALCTIETYTAVHEGTTYEYEHVSAIQFLPLEMSEEQQEAHAAWLEAKVEQTKREKREREEAFQEFLHSDQLEVWLRKQPRCDDNKFLHSTSQKRREYLQWCFCQNGSPGDESKWHYLSEYRASVLLERLKELAKRIRSEEKAKHTTA